MQEVIVNIEDKYHAKIGRVEYLKLGYEDHGILTFMVGLDFKGSGQGFGGYALDSYSKDEERRIGTMFGTECVIRLLKCFDVDDISKIKGKACLALYEKGKSGWGGGKILGLAPLPSDDGEPFILEECVEFCKKRGEL